MSLSDALDALDSSVKGLHAAADALDIVGEILEQMPVMVIVGNGTHWRYVSRPFSDLLGYDREALGKIPFIEIIHPADLAATVQATLDVVRTGEPGSITNRYLVLGTDNYRRLSWTWNAPATSGYTVAVATDLGPA